MEFADGVKEFVKPAIKLIETVAKGVGTLYEPTKTRRMAEARAYEITTISDAVRSNMDVPIVYNPENGIIVDASNFQELAKRAGERFLFHEITKQQNIESVITKAHLELEGEENVPNEPVDQDWVLRFFNSVGEISNEQIQNLWAKVLSGEVKKPGSFSLRTLQALSILSPKEAEAFERVAHFSMNMQGNFNFLYGGNSMLAVKHGFNGEALTLGDIGLILEDQLYLRTAKQGDILFKTTNMVCAIKNNVPEEFGFRVIGFTSVATELLKLISIEPNENYIIDCAKAISALNPKVVLTMHRILKTEGRDIIIDDSCDLLL